MRKLNIVPAGKRNMHRFLCFIVKQAMRGEFGSESQQLIDNRHTLSFTSFNIRKLPLLKNAFRGRTSHPGNTTSAPFPLAAPDKPPVPDTDIMNTNQTFSDIILIDSWGEEPPQ